MTRRRVTKKKGFSLSNIDFTKAATKAAGLAAGSIGGAAVNNVIVKNLFTDKATGLPSKNAGMLSNGITAVVGTLLPEFVEGDFMHAVADGMVAIAAVNLANTYIPEDIKTKLGIAGTNMQAYSQVNGLGLLRDPSAEMQDWYNSGQVQRKNTLSGMNQDSAHVPVLAGNTMS